MTKEERAAEKEAEIAELAEHHERQGILHAKQAKSNAPWYHAHETDTRRAAEHFAVSKTLRDLLEGEQ